MKKIFASLFILCFASQLFAGDKENVKSTITDVTVYTQGAQIFRKATYNVKPGITEIIIDGICPTIDAKSLQVKATGNIVILDSKYSMFYPEPKVTSTVDGLPLKIRKDIQFLQDSINAIQFDLQEIQDEIDVLNATKSILSNNGAIRGQGKVNDSIQLLKQAVDYYAIKMNEINKQLLKLNRRKAEKNIRKSEMQNRLNNLQNYQSTSNQEIPQLGPTHRIIVTVSSKEIKNGKITLSYLVSGAGWIPLYDIRSELAAGKVNLNYKAQVFQNTGSKWEDVKLTISTNNPFQNKIKPTLNPWYIDYYQARPMPGSINSNGYMAPVTLNASSAYEKSSSKDSYRMQEEDAVTSAQFTQIISQMISAEFRIDLQYTIPSTNEKHMVLISNTDLAANYKYYTVPKMDASVYLVAQISKLDELQLVPAKANIFFDGSYIGETYIDPSSMEDTLSLSLGKDPNLIVKRTLLKKESKERVIGDKIERTNNFQIEIKNLKSTNATIVVQDQMPITQNSEIIIEPTNTGKAKHDLVTGMLEWEINLKTKESKTLNFSYTVKFDKNKSL
jgi:uncharacterized protein (TIGR02231 family)